MAVKREIMAQMASADLHLTNWGTNFYWAATGIFNVAAIAFFAAGLASRKHLVRVLYFLSALSCYIACLAYFAMGANMGWTAVQVEFPRDHRLEAPPTRQVFWVRAVVTPLSTVMLSMLTDLSPQLITMEVVMSLLVIITGLVSALIPTSFKWAYFGYGAVPWAGVTYLVMRTGYQHISGKHPTRRGRYLVCAVFCMSLFLMYGVVWGLSEGGNVVSVDVEGLLYGLADLFGIGFNGLVVWAASV
ncbi:hypothetical protein AWENTII_006748 [Aspergillus wentii]